MRILMLTPYLPYPPSSGGQIRSYNLIKQLSKSHEITLFSLVKYEEDKKYVKNLEGFCKEVHVFNRAQKPWTLSNIISTGFSAFPFLVIRNFSKEEKKALAKIITNQHFDIIHAETFYVSPHIPKTDIPIVLVDQTIEYQVYKHYADSYPYKLLRPLLYIDVFKLKYWEEHYWRKATRVVAVSERDAKIMKYLVKGLKASVIPNGVGEDLMEKVIMHYNQTILFMGNYAWLQNIEAAKILAKEIFPEIKKKLPDIRLLIAGQNTDKLGDFSAEGVSVRDLPFDDVEGVKKAYQQSGVLVAPLYGPGGTRLKILGAMAAKLPVVTTDIGIEGIDAEQGESVLYGQTNQALINLTVKLLEDRKLYERIAINARKLVEDKYSYVSIAKNLSQIYEELRS